MTRSEPSQTNAPAALSPLVEEVSHLAPEEAAARIEDVPDAQVADLFRTLGPALTNELLQVLDEDKRRAILAAAPAEEGRQWARNLTYPDDCVGRLMELPQPVFPPRLTVRESTARIRELVKTTFVTYAFVVDDGGKLVGVVTMRDLLLADEASTLETIMLRNPFALSPELPLVDAARQVVARHFPVYPVCDADGRLVGTVRGRSLFEVQALEISAQAGAMVGVEKEERLATPWQRSLRFRHPWLQLNLFTAFLAAAVVGLFQGTINRLVVLAVFLPVLAGQSGNTGCQALAVTLRGLTLGELRPGAARRLVAKEALLGLLNGALVGITAGIGMFIVARAQGEPQALVLGLVVFGAMCASCVVSGLAGALIPLTLRSLGADPATASSIFLTTATDVASMGLFLTLATLLVR
ncbi:MAG TPA: magnesium transporter [Planctomycetota bacterium]|jgi:magnesium transporter|nr:magnesium transporter [Planctomycetota bacterium]